MPSATINHFWRDSCAGPNVQQTQCHPPVNLTFAVTLAPPPTCPSHGAHTGNRAAPGPTPRPTCPSHGAHMRKRAASGPTPRPTYPRQVLPTRNRIIARRLTPTPAQPALDRSTHASAICATANLPPTATHPSTSPLPCHLSHPQPALHSYPSQPHLRHATCTTPHAQRATDTGHLRLKRPSRALRHA